MARADLRYVVIGGLAVNAHGVLRNTNHLGICPDPDVENLKRLADLLRDIEAQPLGVGDFGAGELPFDPTGAGDLAQGGNFRLSTSLGSLNIMQWVPGIPGDLAYPTLAADAFAVEVSGMRVHVRSLEHLRQMKRTAGRPQDLQDLADLAVAHGES